MLALLIIITVLLWGTTPILEKIALKNASPLAGLTIRNTAVTLIMWIYVILSGKISVLRTVGTSTGSLFILTGVMAGMIGMFTYFEALRMEATSRIVPLAATYPLVTALLAFFVLGEKISLTRFAGIVFIVIGIYLLK